MPTYDELREETWYNREIVPEALKNLGVRLCTHYDRPADAVGTKGDNKHLRGAHRSQEWILNSRWCTNRFYTVQSGLTARQRRYIGGFDFTPGSESRMIEICSRLDEVVRSGRLEQVLEWYGNDDGDNRVDGYDNIRNRVASSDPSHLWHLHMTLDRRLVNDWEAMGQVGDALLGSSIEVSPKSGDPVEEALMGLPSLRKGNKGEHVKTVQGLCLSHGLKLGNYGPRRNGIDGDFGNLTDRAVRRFQENHKVRNSVRANGTGDGIVGDYTWIALNRG